MADLIAISQSDAGDLSVESKSISGKCLRICVETGKSGAIATETIKILKQRPAPVFDRSRTRSELTKHTGERRMYRMSALLLTALLCSSASAEEAGEWKSIFDGTMNGWKVGENADSWVIEDGKLACKGPKAHLFYVGDVEPFTNFEFECEVMTTPGSNSGIYFHTDYQPKDWPRWGYECQVNITHGDTIKSGSIYGIVKVTDPPAKDNEWYTTNIRVEGRHIVIKINDKVVVDFTEPENQPAFSDRFDRRLGRGTFALQAHDPKSVVYYRGIKVRRLP